jgi:hypothetical protein
MVTWPDRLALNTSRRKVIAVSSVTVIAGPFDDALKVARVNAALGQYLGVLP